MCVTSSMMSSAALASLAPCVRKGVMLTWKVGFRSVLELVAEGSGRRRRS